MSSGPRVKKTQSGRKPDYEADSIRVKAKTIEGPKYFPRSKVHGGNWLRAKDDIEVDIRKSLPGKDKDVRPESGTVLEGKNAEIIITGRYAGKDKNKVDGKEVGTASGGVRIFGRLRRRSG